MGNSCNKVVPVCCSAPIYCTAHVSCSIPICCGPGCCSDPKVQPGDPRNCEVTQPLTSISPSPTLPPSDNPQRSTAAVSSSSDTLITINTQNYAAQPQLAVDTTVAFAQCDSESGVQPAPQPVEAGVPGHKGVYSELKTTLAPLPADLSKTQSSAPDSTSPRLRDTDTSDYIKANAAAIIDAPSPGEPLEPSPPHAPTTTSTNAKTLSDLSSSETHTKVPVTFSADNRSPSDEGYVEDEEEEDENGDLSSDELEPEPLIMDSVAASALESFGLFSPARTLAAYASGRNAVKTLATLSANAASTGVAYYNFTRLLEQIRRVAEVLAASLQHGRATGGGTSGLVREVLQEDIQPVLDDVNRLVAVWAAQGAEAAAKFAAGRAADEEFLDLHLRLWLCCQGEAFLQLLSIVPPPSPDAFVVDKPGGYTAIDASRMTFERLLLLFIMRYPPSPSRTQKARLCDLLGSYHKAQPPMSDEEKMEHIVKTRLDRAARGVLPLLENIISSMWGGPVGEQLPHKRIEKWRLAVRLAVQPLSEATGGKITLPAVLPGHEVQEFTE